MASSLTKPNYIELIEFLVTPFLGTPDALRLDCETSSDQSKLWIRLAFDPSDNGRVLGRGGRTIQSIRRVVDIAAGLANQKVHIEVYGMQRDDSRSSGPPRRHGSRRPSPRKPRRHS